MIPEDYKNPPGTTAAPWRKWFPFLRWWNFIGPDTLRSDLIAGLTGAIIVLPQGVAFAMIAGLPPEYGLYTAIVTPIIAALFGSSLHLISGPTTAISIVVFSSIRMFADAGSVEFIRLTLALTFMTGVFQFTFGLMRMGALVNFVSHSVVVGFTAGAAILIATSQLKNVLGIHVPKGASFLNTWINVLGGVGSVNTYAFLVAVIAIACAIGCRIFRPRLPSLLIAMVLGSLAALLLSAGSQGVLFVGELPRQLPPVSVPELSFDVIRQLLPAAMATALLGLIEALSIARSIATHSQQYIDSNQEFIGQGLSNIVGSFFSSYAGSGSFTRSGINYNAGAMTPLSAVFSSVFLTLILLLVSPLSAYLPIPAMGGIILVVAYNLIDFHHIGRIFRSSRQEMAVLLTTFLATLFLELQFAIFTGVLLSLVLYLIRTAHPGLVNLAPGKDDSQPTLCRAHEECMQFKIIRIDGSLFFGSVHHVQNFFYEIDKNADTKRHVLIMASGINFIDVAGAELLANEARRRHALMGGLYLCELKKEVKDVLQRGGYMDVIGRDHIFTSENEAIEKIFSQLDTTQCRLCLDPIFKECSEAGCQDLSA